MIDQIRTRPDGSIDTTHYIARGRRLRSEQAHFLAHATRPGPAGPRVAPMLTVVLLAVLVWAALPMVT